MLSQADDFDDSGKLYLVYVIKDLCYGCWCYNATYKACQCQLHISSSRLQDHLALCCAHRSHRQQEHELQLVHSIKLHRALACQSRQCNDGNHMLTVSAR
jgi:hypothetical protein